MLPVSPGLWRDEWLSEEDGWILDDAGNYLVEAVTEDDAGKKAPKRFHQGNLRLMASAPMLREALAYCLAQMEAAGLSEFQLAMGREAIAHAMGRE